MNLPLPYSSQPQTIEEIRLKRTYYATTFKQFQNMNLLEQAKMSGKRFTILQTKDQNTERLVTKKRVPFNSESSVTVFSSKDPRRAKMGSAKEWSSKPKDLCRWGASRTPTDKGLPMPGRNCNIDFKTDPGAKPKTSKKYVRFNLDANVTMCYNNDSRSTKMGLAKWSSQRRNLCRWGDDSTETTQTSGSVPRLPRRGSDKGVLDQMLTHSIIRLGCAASQAATAV
jgi:hypothetical protein